MDRSQFYAAVEKVLRELPGVYETTANPVLIIISGLPGTGKSYLARRLIDRLPAVIVESDHVRKVLFPQPDYSGPESMWVHRIAHAVTERLLKAGYRVIYDATNLIEWHREKIYRIAEKVGARLVVVQVVAPEEVIRRRLAQRARTREPGDVSDATWEVYEHLKRRVDPLRRPHLVVDTSGDMDSNIRKILRAARSSK